MLTRQIAPPLIGTVAKKEKPLPPVDQVLTMDEALRGYTAKGAKMMGKFDEFGSITVGKKADLTVLSQNLYKVDVDDITKTHVLLTMMDGRITFVEPSVSGRASAASGCRALLAGLAGIGPQEATPKPGWTGLGGLSPAIPRIRPGLGGQNSRSQIKRALYPKKELYELLERA